MKRLTEEEQISQVVWTNGPESLRELALRAGSRETLELLVAMNADANLPQVHDSFLLTVAMRQGNIDLDVVPSSTPPFFII